MSIVNIAMCDFCGRTAREVGYMISNGEDKLHICEICINDAKAKVDARHAEDSDVESDGPAEEPDEAEHQPEEAEAEAPIEVDAEVIG